MRCRSARAKQVIQECKCKYGAKDGMCRLFPDTPHKCIVLFGISCEDAQPPDWWKKEASKDAHEIFLEGTVARKEWNVVSGKSCGVCGGPLGYNPPPESEDRCQHILAICKKCFEEKNNWQKYGYYDYIGPGSWAWRRHERTGEGF